MKFCTSCTIVVLSLSADSVRAHCGNIILNAAGCDAASITVSMQAGDCTDIPPPHIIEEACASGVAPFGDITKNHYQFDKNYMDGGTVWNEGAHGEPPEIVVNETLAMTTQVSWPIYEALDAYVALASGPRQPSYMSNFNLTESCELRTAICCFTDVKGDASFPDNSQVCHHDLRKSRRSNHVQRGWAEYDDTAPSFCTGFSWSADPTHASNRYKGNSLFDISLRNTAENGYTKNIPGSPMCACIEKMPAVNNVHCRKTSVTNERVKFTYTEVGFHIEDVAADISFEDCGTDFKNYFQANVAIYNEATKLEEHIVTDCEAAKADGRNEQFWISGETHKFQEIDDTQWELITGRGVRFWPLQPIDQSSLDLWFRGKFEGKSIVRRYCDTCKRTHRDIYYKRFTPLPDPQVLDFLDLFLSNWTDAGNVPGVDFNLYSSHQDAENGSVGADPKAWTNVKFQDGWGFPYTSGPTGRVNCQFNSYKKRVYCGEYGYDHAFYLPM